MIKLNLVIIRTENLEETVQWYSQTFNLEFVAEKHENGILHYSAQLDEGLIEVYPTKRSSNKITFGMAIDKPNFEKILLNQNPKLIDEDNMLIKDFEGNSIIVNLSEQTS